MVYAYRCIETGCEITRDFPMGEAPAVVFCEDHQCEARRVFSTSALIMGPGFKKPWADKVQHSDELQDHFRRKP